MMNGDDSCHAYVEHLQHEHSRLNELLLHLAGEVDQLTAARQPRVALDRFAERLADLRQRLQSHFAEEEEGGCLEEAVSRCPSLTGNAAEIVGEHPRLDEMLQQLILQTHAPAVLPADVQRDYRSFAEKLHAHETAESRLLQKAFGAEAADYDSEGED
jgi:predicted nuclease with TOPRIM domain